MTRMLFLAGVASLVLQATAPVLPAEVVDRSRQRTGVAFPFAFPAHGIRGTDAPKLGSLQMTFNKGASDSALPALTSVLRARSPTDSARAAKPPNRTYTVRLKDGGLYADVRLIVDPSRMVVVVQSPGKPPRRIRFQEVATILDADGRDVTDATLGDLSAADQIVSVRIRGGLVYRDVRITVDPTHRIVAVNREGLPPQHVGFDAVESITDATGTDITDQLLDHRAPEHLEEQPARHVIPPGLAGQPPRMRAPRQLPWALGINMRAGGSFPWGDWYAGNRPGLGAGISLSLGLFRSKLIEVGAWWQRLRVDMGALQDAMPPGIRVLDADLTVRRMNIEFRHLEAGLSSRLWGYGGMGVAGYTHRAHVTIADSVQTVSARTEETKLGLRYSLGLIYMFSDRLGMDVGAGLDWVFVPVETDVVSGWMLQLGAGMALAF